MIKHFQEIYFYFLFSDFIWNASNFNIADSISLANNSGTSNAAKCPPLGKSVTCKRFRYFSFSCHSVLNKISLGNLATAVGTFVGILQNYNTIRI